MKKPKNKMVSVEKNGRTRVRTVNNGPVMAQQQFKAECDINNIVNNYAKTGLLPQNIKSGGQFADFSNIRDYQGMLDTILQAENTFMQLDPQIRSRFENNPGKLIEFIQKKQNYDEGVKLGLFNPKDLQQPNTNEQNEQKPASKSKKPIPDQTQTEPV